MKVQSTRGFMPEDDASFFGSALEKLRSAQIELQYLLDRGYPMRSASRFVGSHHQLSARQILALTRTTASTHDLARRAEKRVNATDLRGHTLYLDGLNIIITLEVAFSDGMLFAAPDGVIRDLAALRGTYRLLPQTSVALDLLRLALARLEVSDAVMFLDAPVSNSGKLKSLVYKKTWPVSLDVRLVNSPDAELKRHPFVASGDSIILEECGSWFSLAAWMFGNLPGAPSLRRLVRLDA